MIGINFDELYDLLANSHEAEFEYNGTSYVIQPEVSDNKNYLVIWDCTPELSNCIAKHEIGNTDNIPKAVIDTVLLEKCFNGKSFKDIEKDIRVTVIY